MRGRGFVMAASTLNAPFPASGAPRPAATVRVGARALVGACVLGPAVLECATPAQPERGRVSVEVSLNEKDFSADEVLFEYQPAARIDALLPPVGPGAGGVRVDFAGEGFSRRASVMFLARARFNLTTVPMWWSSARKVRCVAPKHATGPARVSLTQNDCSICRTYLSAAFQCSTNTADRKSVV